MLREKSEIKKEKSIIFSAPMVKAILEGRKTQTRRVMKPQPEIGASFKFLDDGRIWMHNGGMAGHGDWAGVIKCPYGQIGDRLRIKEAHFLFGYWRKNGLTTHGRQGWKFICKKDFGCHYLDDAPVKKPHRYGIETSKHAVGWFKRSPIFMPRWAARITIEIVNVRVERLQDISEKDAEAEGVGERDTITVSPATTKTYREAFRYYWNFLNHGSKWPGKDRGYSWDTNPLVWVLKLARIKQ